MTECSEAITFYRLLYKIKMMNDRKWYALYTRPGWEKSVAEQLDRLGFETYCPLNRVLRQWSDRNKYILEPLFKSYIFVHVTDADVQLVKASDGVLHFVQFLGKPAIIRNEEIEIIRQFLSRHQSVRLEKYDIRVNDKIIIRSGALEAKGGNVIEVRQKIIKVLLPTLGYRIIAEIQRSNIDLVPGL